MILPLRPQTPEYGILDRTSVNDVAAMALVSIALTQINLQDCNSASAVQEPCLSKGDISGLRTCEQYFSSSSPDIRACILVKNVRSDVWAKHCGRELAKVVMHFKSKEGIDRLWSAQLTFRVMLRRPRHPKRSRTS